MSLSLRHYIFKSTLSSAALALLFTGIASAQIKTENFTYNLPFAQQSSAGDFTLPTFDSSLGTLENLQLSLTITGTVTQVIYNAQGKAIGFKQVPYSLPGSISAPGSVVLNATAPTPVTPHKSSGGSGLFLPGGIPLGSYTPHQTVINESDPNVLDSWQGSGNHSVDLSYTTSTSPSIASNFCFPHSFNGTAKVTVSYTYDSGTLATPEPQGKYLSAIVALGMMFIFLGRRKRSAA